MNTLYATEDSRRSAQLAQETKEWLWGEVLKRGQAESRARWKSDVVVVQGLAEQALSVEH